MAKHTEKSNNLKKPKPFLRSGDDWPNEGVLSSSGITTHNRPEAYIAEIIMTNRHPEIKGVDKFWKDKKYNQSYRGFLMQSIEHIRAAGFRPVLSVVLDKNIKSFDEDAVSEIIKKIGEQPNDDNSITQGCNS